MKEKKQIDGLPMKKRPDVTRRRYSFFIAGGASVIFNLGTIFSVVRGFGWDNFIGRCIANAVAVELSVFLSFFLYRFWVWPRSKKRSLKGTASELVQYHIFSIPQIFVRTVILFPFLDHWGVPYLLNALFGALTSVFLNYHRPILKGHIAHDRYQPESLPLDPHALRCPSKKLGAAGEIKTISILIPVHNEAKNIRETVEAIVKRLSQERIHFEVLIVNDHSRDRTEDVLRALSSDKRVRYINNLYPNGFGFAIRYGLEHYRGDAVIIVMGDLSDSPDHIVDYHRKLLEGNDCVFGSRFMKESRLIDYPAHKLFLNRLANKFIQILFGLKYNDVTNAFKAYRSEVVRGIMPLVSNYFNLTVEMPLKAIVRGYSYAVIPISWQNRKRGISKLKIREMGSRYLFIVLSVFLEKKLAGNDYLHETRGATSSNG